MAADYYEVDLRTIENCLSANENELHKNGYRVLTGKELKEFKLRFDAEIDFGIKTVRLGVFDFRSFLNIGMLLTTSEKAKQVRSLMLDIVIAVVNDEDYSESIKLELIEAMSKDIGFSDYRADSKI